MNHKMGQRHLEKRGRQFYHPVKRDYNYKIPQTRTGTYGFPIENSRARPIPVIFLVRGDEEARVVESYAWPKTASGENQGGVERYILQNGKIIGWEGIDALKREVMVYEIIKRSPQTEAYVSEMAQLEYNLSQNEAETALSSLFEKRFIKCSILGNEEVIGAMKFIDPSSLSGDPERREKSNKQAIRLARQNKFFYKY